MLITSFRVRKIEAPTNRLVAKCTITFDGMFAVSDICKPFGKILNIIIFRNLAKILKQNIILFSEMLLVN